ncbi:MAG: ABC transporter permease [Bacteroides sp.]|nr:ABC transporter permease [Bacteroides sp.]
MIRLIIKQLWYKRRANGWLLAELVLVTFFLWIVIDPMFVLLANRAIPEGYNVDHTFLLTLGSYRSGHSQFVEEAAPNSVRKENFLRIQAEVQRYPGVESVAIVGFTYPFSDGGWFTMAERDTLSAQVQVMVMSHQGDYFRVFRTPDIYTGGWEQLDEAILSPNHIVITKGLEQLLFPGRQAVGQTITSGQKEYVVAGVTENFKARSVEQPKPLIFLPQDDLDIEDMKIVFRIRDGISAARFAEEFRRDMISRLSIGNFYYIRLEDFHTIRTDSEYQNGSVNKIRMQSALTVFFLLCTFLGVAGTFWIRSNARRGEIGLRMALGSTRSRIQSDLLTESWLLTTVAFLLGLLIAWQYIYQNGFAYADKASYPESINSMYIQNQPVAHFLIVSLIVYFLMMMIALTATWIPAHRAAATEPSEALRDE